MTESFVSESGSNWDVKSEGETLVWTFKEGMDLSKFKEEAYPTYERILQDEGEKVNGMVTIINFDNPFNKDAFEVWEKAGKKASEEGIERWAVVAEGITKHSLHGKVDVDGLKVHSTEDKEEALDWARDNS